MKIITLIKRNTEEQIVFKIYNRAIITDTTIIITDLINTYYYSLNEYRVLITNEYIDNPRQNTEVINNEIKSGIQDKPNYLRDKQSYIEVIIDK